MAKTGIIIPFTVTGGVSSTINTTQTLSGFTNALTTFQFTVSSQIPNYISNDKFVWHFGDGTYTTAISAEHVYTVPGKYVVSLLAYSSAGEQYLSTHTESLSVSDWLQDSLSFDNSNSVFNVRNIVAGRPEDKNPPPITVHRVTNWQTYPALSAHNKHYTLNAYVSGSLSDKQDALRYKSAKWAHIGNTWSFYEKLTADNKSIYYNPVNTISTTTEEIYFQKTVVWDYNLDTAVERYARVPLAKVLAGSPHASGSVLVGTSGTGDIYYADDTPSKGTAALLANISLNTDDFRDVESISTDDRTYYNRVNALEQLSLKIPIRVKRAPARSIQFTSSSIRTMNLSKNKWQMSEIPFFINIADSDGAFQKDRAPLSINPHPSTPSTTTNVINLSVVDSTGAPLSAHFFRTVDTQLPSYLSGAYRGIFVPRDTGNDVQLAGDGYLYMGTTYLKDTNILWVSNAQLEKLYRLIPSHAKYTVDSKSGDMEVSLSLQSDHSYAADTLPIATAPLYDELSRDDIVTHIADTSTDQISSFNTYGVCTSSIDLTNVYVDSLSAISDLRNIQYPYASNLAPSCIAIDGNRDFWITFTDSGNIAKFDKTTNNVSATILNKDNISYTSASTGLEGFGILSGFAGFNLYEPGIVDTDKENSVWVAYTSPIKPMIRKYASTGGDPIVSYEFPAGIIPHDMVVDNKNNIWVATIDEQREPRETFTEYIYAQAVPTMENLEPAGFSYYVGTFQSTENVSLSSWQAGEIVESKWNIHDKNFNGKFIISDINYGEESKRWRIDVQPYTGRITQTNFAASSSTQIRVYPSDKIYKFDSNGTKLLELSGFYNPAYICVDGYQHPWVLHDTNTLQQLDATTGATLQTIRVESTEFLTNSAAKFDMDTFADTQLKGVACDTFDNVIVINAFENNLFTYNTITPSTSTISVIDQGPSINSMMYRSYGDWSGFRWINKYFNEEGLRTLTGATTFNILPSGGKYKIAKMNEDFDPSETIKSYRFQQLLLDDEIFFDEFYGSIVGTVSSEPTELGKAIYEKIANFVGNTSDPDTCNIRTLYSMCQQTGTSVDNYNFVYPAGLSRVVDLLSISHKRLYGERSKFSRDFDKSGTTSADIGVNLGSEIDTATYIVSAGIPIVAQQLFNREYTVITPMYIEGSADDPGYVSSVGLLSSYPLSSYSTSWRWRLNTGAADSDIGKYYNFYTYNVKYSNLQLEGVIDWDNPYTNINHTLSSIDPWYEDDGIVDTMIDYELRKGLGLIMPTLSATSPAVQ